MRLENVFFLRGKCKCPQSTQSTITSTTWKTKLLSSLKNSTCKSSGGVFKATGLRTWGFKFQLLFQQRWGKHQNSVSLWHHLYEMTYSSSITLGGTLALWEAAFSLPLQWAWTQFNMLLKLKSFDSGFTKSSVKCSLYPFPMPHILKFFTGPGS